MLCILFYHWQDAAGHYSMGSAKVVVDLYAFISSRNISSPTLILPCRVSVIDCSSFSSSSVSVRLRCDKVLARDIVGIWWHCPRRRDRFDVPKTHAPKNKVLSELHPDAALSWRRRRGLMTSRLPPSQPQYGQQCSRVDIRTSSPCSSHDF
jgi:hypothetical protein